MSALPRILRGDLENVATAQKADGDPVGEVDRARVLAIDLARLKARLGKHEHLRLDRDGQRVEERTKIAVRRIERQLDHATLNLPHQLGDGRRGAALGISDRRMVADALKAPARCAATPTLNAATTAAAERMTRGVIVA